MSLMVGEGQWANAGRITVEGHHVITTRGAILKDENLARPFGSKALKFVTRQAQEAGEIEVARLESGGFPLPHLNLSSFS